MCSDCFLFGHLVGALPFLGLCVAINVITPKAKLMSCCDSASGFYCFMDVRSCTAMPLSWQTHYFLFHCRSKWKKFIWYVEIVGNEFYWPLFQLLSFFSVAYGDDLDFRIQKTIIIIFQMWTLQSEENVVSCRPYYEFHLNSFRGIEWNQTKRISFYRFYGTSIINMRKIWKIQKIMEYGFRIKCLLLIKWLW